MTLKTQEIPKIKNPVDQDYDDDESDDSDYRSSDGSNNGKEGNEVVKVEPKILPMSHKRRREAENIWLQMNEEYISDTNKKMKIARIVKSELTSRNSYPPQIKSMLTIIFGKKAGYRAHSKAEVDGVPKETNSTPKASIPGNQGTSARVKEDIIAAVKKIHYTEKVAEKVKFAGKEITVQVTKSDLDRPLKKAAVSSTLDEVLETLKGPKVISTISKSSLDWDNYKEQEGLQDALAAASKDGYITRQEFLNRCDVRAFETEREERIIKNASGASSAPPSTSS